MARQGVRATVPNRQIKHAGAAAPETHEMPNEAPAEQFRGTRCQLHVHNPTLTHTDHPIRQPCLQLHVFACFVVRVHTVTSNIIVRDERPKNLSSTPRGKRPLFKQPNRLNVTLPSREGTMRKHPVWRIFRVIHMRLSRLIFSSRIQ